MSTAEETSHLVLYFRPASIKQRLQVNIQLESDQTVKRQDNLKLGKNEWHKSKEKKMCQMFPWFSSLSFVPFFLNILPGFKCFILLSFTQDPCRTLFKTINGIRFDVWAPWRRSTNLLSSTLATSMSSFKSSRMRKRAGVPCGENVAQAAIFRTLWRKADRIAGLCALKKTSPHI